MNTLLEHLFQHNLLSRQEAHDLLLEIADHKYPEAQVAALLTVFPLDIVGTGGDSKNTFNISTCACFVVAGAGYKVAKHGNYGASSVSGASTVLEQHGVKFTNDADQLKRSIDQCGMAYLHAPLFHPALAAVGPLRKALKVKTIFNLLGPLVNPCHTAYQLLGVANLQQMRLYTNTLQQIGLGFTVVTSLDGYDEISLTDSFKVMSNHSESIYSPTQLGLTIAPPHCMVAQLRKKQRTSFTTYYTIVAPHLSNAMPCLSMPPSVFTPFVLTRASIRAWKRRALPC